MDSDLHAIPRVQELRQQTSQVKFMMFQILLGLDFIHKSGVLHRDIKPGNIMVNANCQVKIGDFGLGKLLTKQVNNDGDLTDEVATRWYRAPELVMRMG